MRAMFRRVAPFIAVAVTVGIAACSSSGGIGGSGPLASESVKTIRAQATANTLAAQSFTISGSAATSSSVDLMIVHGVGCSGTISQSTGTSKFIWIGATAYAHTASMPANEWMKGSSSQADLQSLINLCKPASYLDPLLNVSGADSATAATTVYKGQSALTLSLPGTNGETGSVVSDARKPLLLDVSEPGSGSFTFSGYGATETITAPASS
jgi:hypothetical protein